MSELIYIFLVIGHIIGTVLGAGGATMSDVLFFTSISDNRIDKTELRLMKVASKVVSLGIFLLAATGVGFLLTGSVVGERFYAKMTIVIVAIINGLIMHRAVFDIFQVCVKENIAVQSERFQKYLPILSVAGAISVVSWYAAIVLSIWKSLTLGYFEIIFIYVLCLIFAAFSAFMVLRFVIEQYLVKQAGSKQAGVKQAGVKQAGVKQAGSKQAQQTKVMRAKAEQEKRRKVFENARLQS